MNIEKYNKLHSEIMNRLEAGEITVERAKEVNDLAFDKYITESVSGAIAIAGLTIMVAPFAFVSVISILNKIRQSKEFKKLNTDEQTADKFEKCMDALANKLKNATISYKPEVLSVMKDNIELLENKSDELKKLDIELCSCNTVEEYREKSMEELYEKLFKELKDKCEKNNKKIKTDSEFVTDNEIVPILKKYLKYSPYNRLMIYTNTKNNRRAVSTGLTGAIVDIGAHKDRNDLISKSLNKYPLSMRDACDYDEVLKHIKIKFN